MKGRAMTGIPSYEEALRRSRALAHLRAFDPRVIGTLPLGIAVPDSDIDIACHAPDPAAFADVLWRRFGAERGFVLYQWVGDGRPVVARFELRGWPFEIFGALDPVDGQAGWRHFVVERRLLDLGGPALRDAVMAQRRKGLKTEPAFAAAIGLAGDPYAALLDLHDLTDAALDGLLRAGGFGAPEPG